jgi:AmmeMemoRadiSam system protein A
MEKPAPNLTPAEQATLVELARRAIRDSNATGQTPAVDEATLTPALRAPRGCFVTLTRRGKLRGCIGNLLPHEPLFQSVMHNACGAAFRDSRFPPVSGDELPELEVEISVLSKPLPLDYSEPGELLHRLCPGVDGVVLNVGGRTATFLPQVWEKIPDPAEFLDQLARKAGLPADAWRDPTATVLTYQAESFEDASGS